MVALPSRPTPRQSLDGVMIDIRSRRPRRVHVHQLARDRPRSPEIAISPRDEGRVVVLAAVQACSFCGLSVLCSGLSVLLMAG